MIKTIDTSQITEEMFKAFRLGDDLSGKIFNLLEAAPEVKTRPIGTLFLGGIEGNEYGEIDVDLKSKALEALQEELVSSENPVVLEVYAHPPAVSEGWIRAIDEALVCHHIDVANADDSYAIAKDKLNKMLCVVQDIGAYFAKQEPAQAVPAFWASENILKDSLRDNISCILTTTKCAANTVPLYTTPPAIVEAVPVAWLPIETAPKDGTEILVTYGKQGFVMQLVRFDRTFNYWKNKGEAELGLENNATNWMPIPDPRKPLYTAPPAIDAETRHRLILVCEYLETVGLMFVSPRVISSQIRAILEAGNGTA